MSKGSNERRWVSSGLFQWLINYWGHTQFEATTKMKSQVLGPKEIVSRGRMQARNRDKWKRWKGTYSWNVVLAMKKRWRSCNCHLLVVGLLFGSSDPVPSWVWWSLSNSCGWWECTVQCFLNFCWCGRIGSWGNSCACTGHYSNTLLKFLVHSELTQESG